MVAEAGALIPRRHRQMLMSILDLEKVTVDDIMVPRQEINAIDLDDPPDEILEQIVHAQHTRLPLHRGDINEIEGILHLRRVVAPPGEEGLIEYLQAQAAEPYFIPAGTPLSAQLLNFQRAHERLGLIVDEWGEIEGLATLEDLLEEIVGQFTTDPTASPLGRSPPVGRHLPRRRLGQRARDQSRHALGASHRRSQDRERAHHRVSGLHPRARHEPQDCGLPVRDHADGRQRGAYREDHSGVARDDETGRRIVGSVSDASCRSVGTLR